MTRLQRWLVIGVSVTVAAFLLGLLGGLTGTAPVGPVSEQQQPEP